MKLSDLLLQGMFKVRDPQVEQEELEKKLKSVRKTTVSGDVAFIPQKLFGDKPVDLYKAMQVHGFRNLSHNLDNVNECVFNEINLGDTVRYMKKEWIVESINERKRKLFLKRGTIIVEWNYDY